MVPPITIERYLLPAVVFGLVFCLGYRIGYRLVTQ